MIVPRVRQRETKQGIETSNSHLPYRQILECFQRHTHSLFESKQTIFVSTLAPMFRSIVSARLILPLRPCPPRAIHPKFRLPQKAILERAAPAVLCFIKPPFMAAKGLLERLFQPVIYTCITPSVHRGKHV